MMNQERKNVIASIVIIAVSVMALFYWGAFYTPEPIILDTIQQIRLVGFGFAVFGLGFGWGLLVGSDVPKRKGDES